MSKEVADAIIGAIRDCFMDCGGPDNFEDQKKPT